MTSRIYLTGFTGSGKSTIAPLLAKDLGYTWVDLDELVEQAAGKDIATIFEDDGEAIFREYEKQAFESLANAENVDEVVVATGGGTLIEPELMQLAQSTGVVIYLHLSFEKLLDRLKRTASRPVMQMFNTPERLRELFETRANMYEKAHFSVDVNQKTLREIVRTIRDRLANEFE
ncbi:MAG: shikimate kinase [Rubricoccaceae bacterium]|nr:shikimate kinase [Rubricoccaceae bacterium]